MGRVDDRLNQLADRVSDLATMLLWQENNHLDATAMVNKPAPPPSVMAPLPAVNPYNHYQAYHSATPPV